MLRHCPNGGREHAVLDVAPDGDKPFCGVGVAYSDGLLFDDRTFVEVSCDEVRGRTNHFHSTLVSLVIGAGALETGKEGVVDVDRRAG